MNIFDKTKLINDESNLINVSKEVQEAIEHGKPIVALESTIITHGLPHPESELLALDAEEAVRAHDDGTVDESHDGNGNAWHGNGWSWRPCWTRWPRSFQIRRHGRLMHHSTTYA